MVFELLLQVGWLLLSVLSWVLMLLLFCWLFILPGWCWLFLVYDGLLRRCCDRLLLVFALCWLTVPILVVIDGIVVLAVSVVVVFICVGVCSCWCCGYGC